MTWPMERARALLQHYFGYPDFRAPQIPAVEAVLSRRDAVIVLPTGGGKSICFQVPALCFERLTVVISPLISLMAGEFGRLDWAAVSTRSIVSMVYLVLVGSVIGYSAYMWLLGVTSAARVSTYAFVNPVVAVMIGSIFANEPLTPRIIVAGAIIVAAVALITLYGGDRPPTTTPVRQPTPVREYP